jgi:hypothetical protein
MHSGVANEGFAVTDIFAEAWGPCTFVVLVHPRVGC